MAARRPLTPVVAALAATALTVGGVLAGTAPVSAAPTQSDECVAALDALETEFGDVDLDPEFDEQAYDDLFTEYEAELDALLDEYLLVTEALEQAAADAEASTLDVEAAQAEFDAAQADLDAAQGDLDAAEVELQVAVDGGDADSIAAATIVRDDALTVRDDAAAVRDDAAALLADAEGALAAVEQTVADLTVEADALDAALVALDEELEAVLDELFVEDGPDIARLLELLAQVALECHADDTDGDGGGVGSAPVAVPVPGRASFTG